MPAQQQEAASYAWTCRRCGKQQSGLPLDHAFYAPDHWAGMSEHEREARGRIDSDVCIYRDDDGRHIFVRGCLEVPSMAWTVATSGASGCRSPSQASIASASCGERL
jgi:hypothetical protein